MAKFDSYKPLLRKWLRKVKAIRVLEWGTGNSTEIMLNECPLTSIHTIEHNYKWFTHWYEVFINSATVHCYYIPMSENYSHAPMCFEPGKEFDLIFIDGRRRVECMKTAREVISETGVVILHDSERGKYKEGKDLFSIIEEKDGTAVMKKEVKRISKCLT